MSETVSTSENSPKMYTAGELLKAAREKMELSLQDVAARLNLQNNIILALEADDKNKLPTLTYVRGYIRSYAKIVNLNADELIRLYENEAQPLPEILPDVKFHTQASSSDKPVKAVTYLLVFGLVLLVLAWWQSNFIIGKNLLSKSENTKNNGGFSYTYDIVIHPDGPFLEKQPEQAVPEELQPYEPDASGHEGMTLPNSLAIDTTLGITDEILASQADTRGAGPDTVSLKVSEKSWIEVYDKDKQKIYMNIAQPGEELKLKGEAPFSVILGNSSGVKVIFNGTPFDQTPHESDGVARFKLGQ